MPEGRLRFDKLVRDSIPDAIRGKGSECETRVLDDTEFEVELLKKVGEEASEATRASTRDELVKEIADLEDVLSELKGLKGITAEELQAAKDAAFAKKGGFAKRLFLLWSSDDGYRSN